MVQTGRRVQALSRALLAAGLVLADEKMPQPRLEHLSQDLAKEVVALFTALGGNNGAMKLRPGSWDLVFEGGLLVELDEELHFNRYRATTLNGEWTLALPWRDDFARYCREHETECLADGSWGRRWSNRSCEVMFGQADEPGVLGELGSPRWKQRALYDAAKDAFALSETGHRVARVSVYDSLGTSRMGAVLDGTASAEPERLASLVLQRSVPPWP